MVDRVSKMVAENGNIMVFLDNSHYSDLMMSLLKKISSDYERICFITMKLSSITVLLSAAVAALPGASTATVVSSIFLFRRVVFDRL